MQVSLEGKVALVTGASKGIGFAIAKSFAESGAKVMLSSRKLDQLVAAASSIDGDTHVFVANVGDVEAAEQCVDATIERFGRLDILVNNAATNPYAGPIMEVDEGRYDKTFQVNVKGPIFWSQAAWRKWMKDNGGVIMNIASVGGLRSEGLLGDLQPHEGRAHPPHPAAGRRARSEGAGRRDRSRPREDRLRADAGRQLRRDARPLDADPAAR